MVRLIIRVLLVGVIAALVGVAALLFSRAQPVRYQAESKLSFSSETRPEMQVLGAPFVRPSSDIEAFTATNAQLVASRHVADEVARLHPQLGLSPDDVSGRVAVIPVTGTQIVQLRATAETPQAAAALANTYQTTFLDWFHARQTRRARRVQQLLRDRYTGLTRTQRASDTGAALRSQLSALDVLSAVGSGTPEVVEGAHASASPQQPQTRRNVIFGVVFGLALGIGLVALRAELTRRPRPV